MPFEYAEANQAVVLTPFILMGAMSPVTIPAALVQQIAEALTGIALAQLIRPGCPVIFGSFLSNIDMQSGSPTFGTPESGIGLLCTGQIARHFGLPFRSGGTLTSSQVPDAQAGYEALMTLMPTFLAGANWVMHSAGWLEGGLVVAGYEKFIVDIELLQMMQVEFTPLEIDEESLAFGAHEEVGSGGHFLGAMHTMERFRTCFYRPLLSSSENYERWMRNGGQRRCRPGHQDLPPRSSRPTSSRRSTRRSAQEMEEYVVRRREGARRLILGPACTDLRRRRARRRLRPHPRLPGPARHRARRVRLPGRARRQHRREPAVRRPAHRPVLHAHRLRRLPTGDTADERCAPASPRSPREFEMAFESGTPARRTRTLMMVSKHLHCLNDLLFRTPPASCRSTSRSVVSNHPDAEPLVRSLRHRRSATSRSPRTPRPTPRRELLDAARRARHPSGRARALHAGALRRPVPRAVRAGRSTSTTRSCPASRAPSPTTRPTSAA